MSLEYLCSYSVIYLGTLSALALRLFRVTSNDLLTHSTLLLLFVQLQADGQEVCSILRPVTLASSIKKEV